MLKNKSSLFLCIKVKKRRTFIQVNYHNCDQEIVYIESRKQKLY